MGYWIGYICMGFVPVQPPRVIRGLFWSHLVSTFKTKEEKKKKKKNLRGIEYFICIVREVSSKEILCFIFDRVVSPCWVFLAHLSHRLRVSYCHWPMSVVRRLSSTIALNNISSETARPRALIFGM